MRERGVGRGDVALVSIDTRSAAWQRLREKESFLRLELAAPPTSNPVAILIMLRSDARLLMSAAGTDARYSCGPTRRDESELTHT
jgi:hypothetical protein